MNINFYNIKIGSFSCSLSKVGKVNNFQSDSFLCLLLPLKISYSGLCLGWGDPSISYLELS